MKKVMKDVKGIEVETPFKRIPYDQAMARFALIKPDPRSKWNRTDVSEVVKEAPFKVFSAGGWFGRASKTY